MKYLTVIWGMIIFLLACVPCTDSGTTIAQGNTTVTEVNSDHEDTEQESDLCSPLCECNCCGGITLSFHFPKLSEQLHFPQIAYLNTYNLGGPVSPDFSFWHPPKA